jgi:tetratricopeptide (TPR) repeat protein
MLLPSLYRLVPLLGCLLISGCMSTLNGNSLDKDTTQNRRASLSELAEQQGDLQLDKFTTNKAIRAAKLAEIYQQLLTLEPDPDVRVKVEYRLVQINTEVFENQAFGGTETVNSDEVNLTLAQLKKDDQALSELIVSYQSLLRNHPEHDANEHIRYQLAKALDLQGRIDESLVEMESLLKQYPTTKYVAELNFRRGEIYYNLQDYSAAINAYDKVIKAPNNDNYLVNSIYMSGWSLFKLNRLPEADIAFLTVFDAIIAAEKQLPYQNEFSFSALNDRYQNLAIDTQRVLSVSLSQQAQSASLVKLVTKHHSLKYLPLYEHVLFENLANFLIKKELKSDAELTYKAYIKLARNNIWSARYSLALLDIYQRDGRFASMHLLKNNYIKQYGLEGEFWHEASLSIKDEILPHLLQFSDEHARRVYARAQGQEQSKVRIDDFSEATLALATYLKLAKLPQAKDLLTRDILTDEYLYADANFEAQQYQKALKSYEDISYYSAYASPELEPLKLQSAYATTLTIRELLNASPKHEAMGNHAVYLQRIDERNRFDQLFIKHYPNDQRSLELATHAVQYSFDAKDFVAVKVMSNFVLKTHGIILQNTDNAKANDISRSAPNTTYPTKNLSSTTLKQIQIVSQLSAHSLYEQGRYQLAEDAYLLALHYADTKISSWQEMRNLLASSIYFQAQAYIVKQPKNAVYHLLRVGKVVPESTYRITAEFDAANLLLEQKIWQQAIDVLLQIKKNFPTHEYTASIPAKLASSYEATEQWELAAEQLLIIVASEESEPNRSRASQAGSAELKREAQYTAADYYLKAGNTTKALTTFRSYAHTYPEPFNIAQEVRFKMSEFYRQSNEPNKEYYWFRKILSFHKKQSNFVSQTIQPRAVELASMAAFGLGAAHQKTFRYVKLNAPLQKSLKRKQTAMKQAIQYYQQVLGFQLAQYVPQTTFNLAEMYRQLAADVLKSQRPTDLDELALEEYEILLEELAYPFEEKAIEIHLSNSQRAWQNIYDQWIEKSFATLAEIAPALYNKKERAHDVIDEMH